MGKNICYYESPIGILTIVEDEVGICEIVFGKVESEETEDKFHTDLKSEEASEKSSPLLCETKKQLTEYFSGERKTFDIPLSLRGTEFQVRVWKELMKIPYGETRSYKEIAGAAGNIKACRAVGMANNKNKIPIIIPCHRVIGSNKKMVGYAGGLDKKEYLLALEQS